MDDLVGCDCTAAGDEACVGLALARHSRPRPAGGVAQRFLPFYTLLLVPDELAPLDEAALAAGAEEPTGVHSVCLWRGQSATRHSSEQ